MVEILAAHKRELEIELRKRIQAFFEANDEPPESVSIEMELSGSGESLPTIHILVKDACTQSRRLSAPPAKFFAH